MASLDESVGRKLGWKYSRKPLLTDRCLLNHGLRGERKTLPGPPPALIHRPGLLWKRLGKPFLRGYHCYLLQASHRMATQLTGGGNWTRELFLVTFWGSAKGKTAFIFRHLVLFLLKTAYIVNIAYFLVHPFLVGFLFCYVSLVYKMVIVRVQLLAGWRWDSTISLCSLSSILPLLSPGDY